MRNAFLTYFWRENSNNFIFRAKRDENHRPKQNLNGPKTWFIHFPIGLEKAVLLIPSGREKAFTQCYHRSRTDALYWVLIAIVPIVRNGPIWPYRRRLALLIDDQDLLTAVILLCEPILVQIVHSGQKKIRIFSLLEFLMFFITLASIWKIIYRRLLI